MQFRASLRDSVLAFGGVATILAFWWLASGSGWVDSFFLPSPLAVASTAVQAIGEAGFWRDLGLSVLRIATGFALATGFAVPIGFLMGRSTGFASLWGPPISFIRFVPMPSVIPLMILWFGPGNWGNAIIICLGVFFQLVLMVADTARNVRREYVELAITLRATPLQRFRFFLVPAAAPGLVDAMRINFGLAWATLVFAEMLGATSGLGYDILRSQRYLLVPRVFVIIVVIGFLGIAVDKVFALLHRRFFSWAYHQTGSGS